MPLLPISHLLQQPPLTHHGGHESQQKHNSPPTSQKKTHQIFIVAEEEKKGSLLLLKKARQSLFTKTTFGMCYTSPTAKGTGCLTKVFSHRFDSLHSPAAAPPLPQTPPIIPLKAPIMPSTLATATDKLAELLTASVSYCIPQWLMGLESFEPFLLQGIQPNPCSARNLEPGQLKGQEHALGLS